MHNLEIIVSSMFFQFALYVGIRLAHGGFTLGELGIVSFGGTALYMELLNLTTAKVDLFYLPCLKLL